jgi:hypothetical protein
MAAKLTTLTNKIAIQLHLVAESLPFAVLAPGGQSVNFWIHTRTLVMIFGQSSCGQYYIISKLASRNGSCSAELTFND